MELCENLEASAPPSPSQFPMENPLFHQVVLQKISSYLSYKDLANFRQVSRYWYDACLSKWCDLSIINVKGCPDLESRITNELLSILDASSSSPDIDQLHPSSLPRPQYHHFRFKNSPPDLWSCGLQITYLEVSSGMMDGKAMANILYWGTPNLKTLKIIDILIGKDDVREALVNDLQGFLKGHAHQEGSTKEPPYQQKNLTTLEFDASIGKDCNFSNVMFKWDHLFQLYPNLEHLRMHLHWYNYPVLNEMLRVILKWRQDDQTLLNLKTLDIIETSDVIVRPRALQELGTSIHAQEFQRLLSQLRFPLETLSLDLEIHSDSNINKGILETHKSTLRTLDIYRIGVNELREYPTPFPFGVELKALTELRLTWSLFEGFQHFVSLPNLKTLHLCQGVEKDQKIKFQPGLLQQKTNIDVMRDLDIFENLDELRFDIPLCNDELVMLIRWMPNLKKVMMPVVTNDDVEVMCGGWEKLEDFTIWPSKFDAPNNAPDLCLSFQMTEKLKRLRRLQVLPDPFILTTKRMNKCGFREYAKNKRIFQME